MLNEVPNNHDITRIANIVLNKAHNINDAMIIGNNVHLTAMGHTTILNGGYTAIMQKSQLTRDER